MSLIDEALKRAQAAQAEGPSAVAPGGARGTIRPWSPAPLPDAGLARRHRFVRLAITLLAVAGAGSILFFGFRRWRVAGEHAEARPAARAGAVDPLVVPTPAPRPSPVEVQVPPPPASRADAPNETKQAAPPAAERAKSPEKPAAEEATSRPAPPRSIANGKTYRGSVTLPDGTTIELGGIAWSEDDPHALVNDRSVGIGGFVEGFEVTSIAEDRIALEKDGLRIYLAVK